MKKIDKNKNKLKKQNKDFIWKGKVYKYGTEDYELLMEYLKDEMLREIDDLIELGSNYGYYYNKKRNIKDNEYPIYEFQTKYHLSLNEIKVRRFMMLTLLKFDGGYMDIKQIYAIICPEYKFDLKQVETIFIFPLYLNNLININEKNNSICYCEGGLEKYITSLEFDKKFPIPLLKKLIKDLKIIEKEQKEIQRKF